MQFAWGAFKGAVKELNNVLLVDSDDEEKEQNSELEKTSKTLQDSEYLLHQTNDIFLKSTNESHMPDKLYHTPKDQHYENGDSLKHFISDNMTNLSNINDDVILKPASHLHETIGLHSCSTPPLHNSLFMIPVEDKKDASLSDASYVLPSHLSLNMASSVPFNTDRTPSCLLNQDDSRIDIPIQHSTTYHSRQMSVVQSPQHSTIEEEKKKRHNVQETIQEFTQGESQEIRYPPFLISTQSHSFIQQDNPCLMNQSPLISTHLDSFIHHPTVMLDPINLTPCINDTEFSDHILKNGTCSSLDDIHLQEPPFHMTSVSLETKNALINQHRVESQLLNNAVICPNQYHDVELSLQEKDFMNIVDDHRDITQPQTQMLTDKDYLIKEETIPGTLHMEDTGVILASKREDDRIVEITSVVDKTENGHLSHLSSSSNQLYKDNLHQHFTVHQSDEALNDFSKQFTRLYNQWKTFIDSLIKEFNLTAHVEINKFFQMMKPYIDSCVCNKDLNIPIVCDELHTICERLNEKQDLKKNCAANHMVSINEQYTTLLEAFQKDNTRLQHEIEHLKDEHKHLLSKSNEDLKQTCLKDMHTLQQTATMYQQRYEKLLDQFQQETHTLHDDSLSNTREKELESRFDCLEMSYSSIKEQLETWQKAHYTISEQYHTLKKEKDELSRRCTTLNRIEIELSMTQEAYEQQTLLLNHLQCADKDLKDKNTRIEELEMSLNESNDVANRLNEFIQHMDIQHDKTLRSLQQWLAESQNQAKSAMDTVTHMKDQSNELIEANKHIEQLQTELQLIKDMNTTHEQHNDVLNDALKKVLDRLHQTNEDSDYFVDRRIIQNKLKEYAELLMKQGVVNITGKSKDQMIYILCEACSLQPDLGHYYFGLTDSIKTTVDRLRTQLKSDNSIESDDLNQIITPRPIASLFLEFLEHEANN